MRLGIAALCLVLLPAVAAAQTLPPVAGVQRNLHLSHQTLGSDEAELSATDVLQDQNGFIWVGTNDGLFRIGGTQVTAFEHSRSEPRTLSDDQVVALHLDQSGALWVATATGLSRYDPLSERFDRHLQNSAEALTGAQLTAVLKDNVGILWLGTQDKGLFAIEGDSVRHFRAQTDSAQAQMYGLPHNHISALTLDSNNNLWVGTDGGGFARFDRRTEQFVSYNSSAEGLSSDRISRIYEDPQGQLWIASHDAGLNLFDPERQSFKRYRHDPHNPQSLSDDRVTDVLTDANGATWVATRGGLNELINGTQFARYLSDSKEAAGLVSNDVAGLHQDSDGVLWIATNKGVDRWNYLSDAFRYLGQSKQHRVSAAAECPDGQLWVGTRNRGIAVLARESGRLTFVPSGAQRIRSLLCDASGTLWIGSADAGLLRMKDRPGTAEAKVSAIPELAHIRHITSLVADHTGNIWVGTAEQGLLTLEANADGELAWSHFTANPEQTGALIDDAITTLFVDAENGLWIGTNSGDLSRLQRESQQFQSFALTSDRGQRAATDLLQSKNGDLWIATRGNGLLRWPAEQRARGETRFTYFTKASGLPSDYLRALLEDQEGNLWISSNRGLLRFNPATLKMRRFDRNNGLRGDRFYSGAKLISRSGQLFFGSREGLIRFYPAAISQLKSVPRITLSAHNRDRQLLRTYGSAGESMQLVLKPDDNYLEFRFSALQHIAPDHNDFLYQLLGFDEGWHSPGVANNATYTSLPPGKYQFRVKASNPDGIWTSDGATVSVEVHAPMWRTGWAKLLYGLLALATLCYLLFGWRREVERLRNSRRNLEIQVEHRATELEERNRQLQELNVRLQEASITDPLTGLLNRRSFYEFVSREVARVERSYTGQGEGVPSLDDPNRRILFFMMIDLDAFKPINDTFGHHTGDHTLVQVSDLLRACARDADTVFRWGGDEFLVIGQVNGEADMDLLAERIRKTIAEHRFDPKYGKALRLSASIGVAPYPFCPANPGIAAWEQVADVADLAAYLAKTHGKNAWVSARGADDLTAIQMQQVKDNFELLIETRKIVATSSETLIPIPGATRIQ